VKLLGFLSLLIISSAVSFGQSKFGKVKCDSFEVAAANTDIALVYKKGKVGIYNKATANYLFKRSEGPILHLQGTKTFLKLSTGNLEAYSLNEDATALVIDGRAKDEILFQGKFGEKPNFRIDGNLNGKEGKAYKSIFDTRSSAPINYGAKRINKNLILITNTRKEEFDPFAEPLKSIIDPKKDSTVTDPESGNIMAVYPPSKPGHNRSGIYNLKTKSWFVLPKYSAINELSDGFALERLSDNGLVYSFLKMNGQYMLRDIPFETIKSNEKELLALLGVAQIDLYAAANQLHPINFFNRPAQYHLVRHFNNKYQLVNLQKKLNYVTQPKDMMTYNRDFNYFIWIENDSIYFTQNALQLALPMGAGKIVLTQTDPLNRKSFELFGMINKDTVYQKEMGDFGLFKEDRNLSIEVDATNKDEVIISNQRLYSTFDELKEIDREEGFVDELIEGYSPKSMEVESSAIWKKENGTWIKKTVDYAGITRFPYGYLAKTGAYAENDERGKRLVNINAHYLVLNKEYKAIPYLDVYDFDNAELLPYGLVLCLNNRCAFVCNDGVLLTKFEWDDFSLEGGKLKALRFAHEGADEFLWEEREWVDSTAFFDLPK